jgi:hypothetical protein
MNHRYSFISGIVFTFLLFISEVASAQAPAIEWEKSYGGSCMEWASDAHQTNDSGYIIAGSSYSNNGDVTGHHPGENGANEWSDYWIVKTDKLGVIQWEKSYGGTGPDDPRSIQQTADGGYIIAGSSNSTDGDVTGNHGWYDEWVVKLDEVGNIQWEKCYGSSNGEDDAACLRQTKDGGYIVAGASNGNGGDVTGNHNGNGLYNDVWLLKLDNMGSIEWEKCYGGKYNDAANSIEQTKDGGYIVVGYSSSNDGDVSGHHGDTTTDDYWIIKLDRLGAIQWEKSLGGSGEDQAWAVQQTRDNGYVVAGYSKSNNDDVVGHHGDTLSNDYWIVKLDSLGKLEWNKSLGGSGDDEAYSIHETSDGYVVAGWSASEDGDVKDHFNDNPDSVSTDYWLVKLDSVGDIQWNKCYGGSGNDDGQGVEQTVDGGYVLFGLSNSTDGNVTDNHGLFDYWIVKLYPDRNNLTLAVPPVNFDTVGVNNFKTLPVVLTNIGVAPVTIAHFQLLGSYSNDYTVLGNPLTTILPGATDSIPITFRPTIKGTEYIIAEIVGDNGDTTDVNLYGAGGNASSVSEGSLPLASSLAQNYPNPFNEETAIIYSIPDRSLVTLTVFDELGREVITLASGEQDAGAHTAAFNDAMLPAGVYYYQLRAGASVSRRMMQIVK